MSIINEIKELDSIDGEIKRMSVSLRKLRSRKKELEKIITEFLERHEQPGVKYHGKTFVAHKKEKTIRKKQSDKENAMYHILSRYVRDPDKIVNEVMQSQKGGMRLLNNPQLIKLTDQFAEFYVVFMQNSEKFFDKADEYVNDTDASSDLPDDIYDQLDVLLIANTQQKLKFTQLELENMFDLVATQMTPNMTKAISQRANKHFKDIIKNESVYGNF